MIWDAGSKPSAWSWWLGAIYSQVLLLCDMKLFIIHSLIFTVNCLYKIAHNVYMQISLPDLRALCIVFPNTATKNKPPPPGTICLAPYWIYSNLKIARNIMTISIKHGSQASRSRWLPYIEDLIWLWLVYCSLGLLASVNQVRSFF